MNTPMTIERVIAYLLTMNEVEMAGALQQLAATPEGWQLVPEDPSSAMIDAADRVDWSDAYVRGTFINMWHAMLAAAPSPKPCPFTPVMAELQKALRKFPTWPTDPLHALAVLGEEYGELTKDVLQMTYEPHKTSREAVRTEALQTAAMALRFYVSLDTYEYKPGMQHEQPRLGSGAPQ